MTKRIHIDQLQLGMHVVGLDTSWWKTPFWSHKWTVQSFKDIEKLRSLGINAVDIDPTQGRDIEEAGSPVIDSVIIPSQEVVPVNSSESPVIAEISPALHSPPSNPFLTAIVEALPAAHAAHDEAVAILKGIFEGMKVGKPIDSPAVKHTVSGLLATILHRPEASLVLTQLHRFERDLLTHSVDVCVLSLVVGKQQSLSQQQLEILGFGALLHDVGKMRLPRNLLRKSNVNTQYGQKLLKEHPRLGVSLLSREQDVDAQTLRIIAEHHELADGSGFPEGRRVEQISSLSQIVSIVNLYDEFVSGHGRQVAHLPTQALHRLYQMGQAGTLVNEQVTWTIQALGVYPLGTVVELNTKERGVVVATNANDSSKPTVHVVCDPRGQLLAEPRIVDLLTPPENEPVKTIIRPLEAETVCLNLTDYFTGTM